MPANISKHYAIPVLLILGGVGGLILGTHIVIGAILIIAGILGGISSHISSVKQIRELEDTVEIQVSIMAKAGMGNAYYGRAQSILHNSGSIDDAIRYLIKAYNTNPDDTDNLGQLVSLLALSAAHQQWLNQNWNSKVKGHDFIRRLASKGIAQDPHNALFYDALGMLSDIEGNHTQARQNFQKASSISPSPIWHIRKAVSFMLQGQNENALKECRLAEQKGETSHALDDAAGAILIRLGRYDEAVIRLINSLRRNKHHWKINGLLQEVYSRTGEYRKATIYNLRHSLNLAYANPRNAFHHLIMACLYGYLATIFSMRDFAQSHAIRHSKLANFCLRFLPALEEPWYSLAIAEIDIEHYEQAIDFIDRAILNIPTLADCYTQKALCLAKLGRKGEAISAAKTALHLDPNNEALTWNLQQIESGNFGPDSGRIVSEADVMGKGAEKGHPLEVPVKHKKSL